MEELFGVSMSSIMIALLVLLGLCLLTVAWVAWRRPVIFKLGVRNIPRRKAQTVLIVIGLMLSTLIMAAALGVGDTFDYSLSSDVYDALGPVDEIVVSGRDGEGQVTTALSATFDDDALPLLDGALADDPQVDGVLPFLLEAVPARNTAKGQAEPEVWLAGTDPERLQAVGGLLDLDGDAIALDALGANEVVIAERTADALDAAVGDTLTLAYNNVPFELGVAGIAQDSILAGALDPPFFEPFLGMVMPLDQLQAITDQPATLSFIAISNAGDARGGGELSDDVMATLDTVVAGQALGVDAIKQDRLDNAQLFATVFTGFFLVLGLFSIAAGIMLIILIFTMLAAERRPEMGMERAVGAHRRQLVQQFISEGAGYALVAGVVGAALGVLATYAIAWAMRTLFGDFFPIEARVTARSMIVAYCLGVVITFLAVVISSWRISRLNVVAAVRDIPDVVNPVRKKRTLVWGALLILAGAGLTLLGLDIEQLFAFGTGMSLWPFGVALVLRFFGVPSRPVFTIVGVALLIFWLLPDDTFTDIFGEFAADFEMFFVSGIFMVLAATIVIVNNLDLLLAGVSRLGGLFGGILPAVRTAIAYPGAARARTGMTIAMFSLIVFSLVMIATMSSNFANLFLGDEANAGWDVRADASDTNPIDDFQGALEAERVDTDRFAAVGEVTTPATASQFRLDDGEFKPSLAQGFDDAFLHHSTLTFGHRAEGYANDAAIIEALRTEPDVAVIDASAIPGNGDPNGFTLDGVSTTDTTFAPITIEADALDGPPAPLTIIGVIDQQISTLFGLYLPQTTFDRIYPRAGSTAYYVAAKDPEQAGEIAKEVEAALLDQGVQATSIRDELEEGQRQFTGFLYLIQGFMGLGLIVGIAAVGVIAFRSVIERRQQIGVLRALGFQRSLVSLSFLIETAFIVILGVVSGTVLGVLLARAIFTSDDVGSTSADFTVPWGIITIILSATVVVALLMAWLPSRQAAGIAPADALRYE